MTTDSPDDRGHGASPSECSEAMAVVVEYAAALFDCDRICRAAVRAAAQTGDKDAKGAATARCYDCKRAAHGRLWRTEDEYWMPDYYAWPSDHDPAHLGNWRARALGPDACRVGVDKRLVPQATTVATRWNYEVRRFDDGWRIVDLATDDPQG